MTNAFPHRYDLCKKRKMNQSSENITYVASLLFKKMNKRIEFL